MSTSWDGQPGSRRSGARPYHHGNLASALVQAGLEIVAADGPDALALRRVARRVGVSPTAAYRHFDGQAGLIEAVKQASQERFAEHLRRSMDEYDAPRGAPGQVPLPGIAPGSAQERAVRRLEAVGRAYFEFAITEPGLFRSFCIGMSPSSGQAPSGQAPSGQAPSGQAPSGEPAFGVLLQVLDELVDTGVLGGERRAAQIDIALWSAIHGLSVLCLDGPLADAPREHQYEMLTAVTDVVFHGLAGPGD